MKDNRLEQRIQHSLNAELSGLNTTSWQRDQFFENATGGNKVKRKLTYSLALAIVMLLIAATALAAAITNGFGLMDFWKDTRDNVEIPEDAGQYIEHDLAEEETEHFTVRFREDGSMALVNEDGLFLTGAAGIKPKRGLDDIYAWRHSTDTGSRPDYSRDKKRYC